MPLYYLNHCRDAIYLALKSMRLPKGSRVGLTAFNCQTVLTAVVAAGYEPVFLDITPNYFLDIEDLKRKSADGRIDLLIVTHLYGKINDISQIRNVVKEIPIIEDCAHAWSYFASVLPADVCPPLAVGPTHQVPTNSHPTPILPPSFFVTSLDFGKCLGIGPGGLLYAESPCVANALDKLYADVPQVSCLQNIVINITLPFRRFVYASFLPRTLLWKATRKHRHRRLRPWQPPHKIAPTVQRAFQRTDHTVRPFFLMPDYQNSLRWAAGCGYKMGSCPVTEDLLGFFHT